MCDINKHTDNINCKCSPHSCCNNVIQSLSTEVYRIYTNNQTNIHRNNNPQIFMNFIDDIIKSISLLHNVSCSGKQSYINSVISSIPPEFIEKISILPTCTLSVFVEMYMAVMKLILTSLSIYWSVYINAELSAVVSQSELTSMKHNFFDSIKYILPVITIYDNNYNNINIDLINQDLSYYIEYTYANNDSDNTPLIVL